MRKYESELQKITTDPYLNSEDLVEEVKLKKMKLHCKDEMERIAARVHRARSRLHVISSKTSPCAALAYQNAAAARAVARRDRERLWYCLTGMVKEGYYFGLPPLVLGGAAFLPHWIVAAILLVFLAAFVFYFFRDPERVIPTEPGALVSPADGRIVVVTDEDYQASRQAHQHLSRDLERPRKPLPRSRDDHRDGLSARQIPGRDGGARLHGK